MSEAHTCMSVDTKPEDPPVSATSETIHPRKIWKQASAHIVDDAYGYNRIPAFWFTLNLPFNYLFEIHRFQRAVEELTATAKDAGDAATREKDVQTIETCPT